MRRYCGIFKHILFHSKPYLQLLKYTYCKNYQRKIWKNNLRCKQRSSREDNSEIGQLKFSHQSKVHLDPPTHEDNSEIGEHKFIHHSTVHLDLPTHEVQRNQVVFDSYFIFGQSTALIRI